MTGTLLDLAKRMASIEAEIATDGNKASIEVATAIVGDLVYHTPVDTSKALSSWLVTFDEPSQVKGAAIFPGKQGSTFRASAAEALALAKLVLKDKKPGQDIYITNNQPYIRKLNDGGHSQQPHAFVERAALLGRKVAARFKVGNKNV